MWALNILPLFGKRERFCFYCWFSSLVISPQCILGIYYAIKNVPVWKYKIVHTLKRWFFKGSLVQKMVLYRTMNTQRTLCMIKGFFASWIFRICRWWFSTEPFWKGFICFYNVMLVTVQEPFWCYIELFSKRFYIDPSTAHSPSVWRTLSPCKEPFECLWFYVELISLLKNP